MGEPLAGANQDGDWGRLVDLPRPVAFVLSGGAACGATQVGMLGALRDAGLRPDLIVGTSVGAINGAMAASSLDAGVDRLTEVWSGIDRQGILGSSSIRCLPRLFRTRRHLFPPDALRSLIQRNVPVKRFESLPTRFAAVATNVADGTPAVLQSGNLERALLASAAIPGVFPRVEIDREWYFDGGVTANLPVRQALELGAKSVVVLDAASQPARRDQPANIAETLLYAAGLMMRSQVSSDISQLSHRCRLVRLPQTSPPGVGLFDFSRSVELIERAYEGTSAFLADELLRMTNGDAARPGRSLAR